MDEGLGFGGSGALADSLDNPSVTSVSFWHCVDMFEERWKGCSTRQTVGCNER